MRDLLLIEVKSNARIFLVGSFRDSVKSIGTLSVINSRVYHHVNVIMSKASYREIEFIFLEKEPSYHLCFYMEPQTCLHIALYIELFQDKSFDLITIKNTTNGSLFLTIYPCELVNCTWVLIPWQF